MKSSKVRKKLAARIKGWEEMVKHSQSGGREYRKPGSLNGKKG